LFRQGRILDLLLKLPRKPILEIITAIEEEIEVMATDEANTSGGKAQANKNRRWRFVLPGKFLVAIVAFYIVNVVKVYFVVSHVDTTAVIPRIYDVSSFESLFSDLIAVSPLT
jgi:hypothetical protein